MFLWASLLFTTGIGKRWPQWQQIVCNRPVGEHCFSSWCTHENSAFVPSQLVRIFWIPQCHCLLTDNNKVFSVNPVLLTRERQKEEKEERLRSWKVLTALLIIVIIKGIMQYIQNQYWISGAAAVPAATCLCEGWHCASSCRSDSRKSWTGLRSRQDLDAGMHSLKQKSRFQAG